MIQSLHSLAFVVMVGLYFSLFVFIDLFYVYVCLCSTWVPGAQRHRKRVSEALKLEEQMGVSHCVDAGGSNPGPLEEQSELFTAGPCLQPYCCFRVLHLGAMPRCGFNLPLPEV